MMEQNITKRVRVKRTADEILNLLEEFKIREISAKKFCAAYAIREATFYKWKSRYDTRSPGKAGKKASKTPDKFISLQVTSPVVNKESGLFAEVRGIKIYQPVIASYLKELSQ